MSGPHICSHTDLQRTLLNSWPMGQLPKKHLWGSPICPPKPGEKGIPQEFTRSPTHSPSWAAGFLSEAKLTSLPGGVTSVPRLKPRGQAFKFLFSSLGVCEVGEESSPQDCINDSSDLPAPHDCSTAPCLAGREVRPFNLRSETNSEVMQGIFKNIKSPLSHRTLWSSHTNEKEADDFKGSPP